jgi:hypothetical protein
VAPAHRGSLEIVEPVELDGIGVAGGSFESDLAMAAIEIEIDPAVVINTTAGATALQLAEPGWTSAQALSLTTGVHRVFTSATEPGTTLKARIRDRSSVVE